MVDFLSLNSLKDQKDQIILKDKLNATLDIAGSNDFILSFGLKALAMDLDAYQQELVANEITTSSVSSQQQDVIMSLEDKVSERSQDNELLTSLSMSTPLQGH